MADAQAARAPKLRFWVIMLAVCMAVSIGIPVAYSTWLTVSYARHSCAALTVLTERPVPKPADPAANPSREQTYEFYLGLVYWERSDGCQR